MMATAYFSAEGQTPNSPTGAQFIAGGSACVSKVADPRSLSDFAAANRSTTICSRPALGDA
jgi:hypothetical protein